MSKIIYFNDAKNNESNEPIKRKRVSKLTKSELKVYNEFLTYDGEDRFLILAKVGMEILLHRGVTKVSEALIKKVIAKRIQLDNIIYTFGDKSEIGVKSTNEYYTFLNEH